MNRVISHVRSWFDFGESWKVDPNPAGSSFADPPSAADQRPLPVPIPPNPAGNPPGLVRYGHCATPQPPG